MGPTMRAVASEASVQWNVRLPRELAERIEARLAELRAERNPALTRTDVVLELLVAGLKTTTATSETA